MVKNKLDSVIARLDRLCIEESCEDAVWDKNKHQRRAKLSEFVAVIDFNLPSH